MQNGSQEQSATHPAWTTPRLVKCGTIADVNGAAGGTSQGSKNS